MQNHLVFGPCSMSSSQTVSLTGEQTDSMMVWQFGAATSSHTSSTSVRQLRPLLAELGEEVEEETSS